MLDPFSRGTIIGLSMLCVAGAIALAPIRGRSSSAELYVRPVPAIVQADVDATAMVPIRRDPFAKPAAPSVLTQRATAPATSTGAAPGGAIGALPSNLSSDTIPALPGSGSPTPAGSPRITAIVTGAHPYAMLETAGRHEIKGIGDRVGGAAIVAIDLSGIRLQNGGRLNIETADRP